MTPHTYWFEEEHDLSIYEFERTEILNLMLPTINHVLPININWVKDMEQALAVSDDDMVVLAQLADENAKKTDDWMILMKHPNDVNAPAVTFTVHGLTNAKWAFAFNAFYMTQALYYDSVMESFTAIKQ